MLLFRDMNPGSIENLKTVLVTGASGVLGKAVVEKYLAQGSQVIALDRKTHAGSSAQIQWLEVNLDQPADVKAKLSPLADRVEGIIHCAGGFRFAKAHEISDQDLDFLINSNLKSAFYLVREILPAMFKKKAGRIVFVSSAVTVRGPGTGMAGYAASKAGLNMLVSALADEVRDTAITVNAVLPTVIDTPSNRKDMPNVNFEAWVKPEELAEVIFNLTGKTARPIHGALIPVTGRL